MFQSNSHFNSRISRGFSASTFCSGVTAFQDGGQLQLQRAVDRLRRPVADFDGDLGLARRAHDRADLHDQRRLHEHLQRHLLDRLAFGDGELHALLAERLLRYGERQRQVCISPGATLTANSCFSAVQPAGSVMHSALQRRGAVVLHQQLRRDGVAGGGHDQVRRVEAVGGLHVERIGLAQAHGVDRRQAQLRVLAGQLVAEVIVELLGLEGHSGPLSPLIVHSAATSLPSFSKT